MKLKQVSSLIAILGLIWGLLAILTAQVVLADYVNFQDYIPCSLTETGFESFGTRMSPEEMERESRLTFQADGTGTLYIHRLTTADSPGSERTYTFTYTIDEEGTAHLGEPGDLGRALFRFNGQEGVLIYYDNQGLLDEVNRTYFALDAEPGQDQAETGQPAGEGQQLVPGAGGRTIPWADFPKPGDQLKLQGQTPASSEPEPEPEPEPEQAEEPAPGPEQLVRGEGAFDNYPGVSWDSGFMVISDPTAYFAKTGRIFDPLEERFLKSPEELLAMIPLSEEMYALPGPDNNFYFRCLNPAPYPLVEAWVSFQVASDPSRGFQLHQTFTTMPGQWSAYWEGDLLDEEGMPISLEDLQVADMHLIFQDHNYGTAYFYFSAEDSTVYLAEFDPEIVAGFYPIQPHQQEILDKFFRMLNPTETGVAVTNTFGRDILKLIVVFQYEDGSQLVWNPGSESGSYELAAAASDFTSQGMTWSRGPEFDPESPYIVSEFQVVLAAGQLSQGKNVRFTAYPVMGFNSVDFVEP